MQLRFKENTAYILMRLFYCVFYRKYTKSTLRLLIFVDFNNSNKDSLKNY